MSDLKAQGSGGDREGFPLPGDGIVVAGGGEGQLISQRLPPQRQLCLGLGEAKLAPAEQQPYHCK